MPATDVEFAGHDRHVPALVACTVLLYVFSPHSEHTLAPAAEKVPAPQTAHVLASEAPVAAENMPAPHSTQAVLATAEYAPALQARHVLPTEAPATAEYVPAMQSVQGCEPTMLLYLPAAHAPHATPSGPV